MNARLAQTVSGQEDWTQFLEGRFEFAGEGVFFRPAKLLSRLQSMAATEGILTIPEGTTEIRRGSMVPVQLAPGYHLEHREDDTNAL